jgi:hypothetical protein
MAAPTPILGDADTDAQPLSEPTRSRRSILAAAVGGITGLVAGALGRAAPVRAAPGDPLVVGTANFGGGASTHLTATSSGGAFWVTQDGFGSGVRGDSVSGHGGVFTSAHPDRYAVQAQQVASSGGGGAAIRADGANDRAIDATSAYGVTILAQNSAFSGIAVHGTTTNGGSAYGIMGESSASNGAGGFFDGVVGVIATSGSATGIGVNAYANGQFGTGLQGYSAGSSGHGVYGEVGNNSANASAIWGYTSGAVPNAYAGAFTGKVTISGTLSKGGGAFRIDHPLDPAHRILQHSFVESPDMKNVYDGVVTTDGAGDAEVRLPDWFEALNDQFRYQLTAIGSSARAWISSEVHDNRFGIRTEAPSTKVSWQVTGIRRDAWANANRIEVEIDKAGRERGLYLHPAEHGQPASKGVDFEAHERIVGRRA